MPWVAWGGLPVGITYAPPVEPPGVAGVLGRTNNKLIMKHPITSLLLAGGLTLFTACNSGYDNNTTRGAAGGAAAGALLGGIIGHQSGDAGAGAALGAAAGGVAGGAYGKHKDRQSEGYQNRDSFGFGPNDYYNLLNPDERSILQSRARGRTDVELTSYLTEEERANLRRRATGHSEIGR